MGVCFSRSAPSEPSPAKVPASGNSAPASNSPPASAPAPASEEQKQEDFNKGRKFLENVSTEYETIKNLGSGGYGKVLSVRDMKSQRVLAMKLVERMRNGADYGDRFWMEYDVLQVIKGLPKVPKTILELVDGFYDDKYYYLVTELLSGGELLQYILDEVKGGFSERQASILLSGMLQSLKFLHENKIVHLDLKPENFVFSCRDYEEKDGKSRVLKLIDFGCSRVVQDNEISNVRTGTPYYIAPEMLTRKVEKTGAVLRACDMWSIGVVLFVLLTGTLPFFGKTRKDILASVLAGVYYFPAEVDLSSGAKDLIRKLLNLDHRARLSAEQALQHPWLADLESVSSAPLSPTVLEGIKNCARDTNLKKALAALLVHDLSEEDKANLKKMFISLDKDKNGVLQYVELVEMVEQFGYDKADAHKVAQKLVAEFDEDRNGVIDLQEFAQIGTRGMLSINEKFVNELFDYLDRDGNGLVTKEEIELYFSEQPNQKMELDVMSLVHEADLNKDGVISRHEFLKAMRMRDHQEGNH